MKKLTTFIFKLCFLSILLLSCKQQQETIISEKSKEGAIPENFEFDSCPVAFSPDGKNILTSFCKNTIYVYDIGKDEIAYKFDEKLFYVNDGMYKYNWYIDHIEYTPDGKFLIATTEYVTDQDKHAISKRMHEMGELFKPNAVSASGPYCKTRNVFIFDASTNTLLYHKNMDLYSYNTETNRLITYRDMWFRQDAKTSYVSMGTGSNIDIRLYDLSSGDEVEIENLFLEVPRFEFCNQISITPDGKYIAGIFYFVQVDRFPYIIFWDATTFKNIAAINTSASNFSFSTDSKYFYFDGQIWSLENFKYIKNLPFDFVAAPIITSVDILPLASHNCFFDGTSRWTFDGTRTDFLDTDLLRLQTDLQTRLAQSTSSKNISPTGEYVAWGMRNASIAIDKVHFITDEKAIFNDSNNMPITFAQTDKLTMPLKIISLGNNDISNSVSLNDSKTSNYTKIAENNMYATDKNEVVIYPDGQPIYTRYCPVTFSPDGKYMLTSFGKDNIYTYDLNSNIIFTEYNDIEFSMISAYMTEGYAVDFLEYSPDGKYLIATSINKTDTAESPNLLFVFNAQTKELMYRKEFSPIDKHLAHSFKADLIVENLSEWEMTDAGFMELGNSEVTMMRLSTGENLYKPKYRPQGFTPDGNMFFSTIKNDNDATDLIFCDSHTGELLHQETINTTDTVTINFTSDGNKFFVNESIWNLQEFKMIKDLSNNPKSDQFRTNMDALTITPDGKYFFDGASRWTFEGNRLDFLNTDLEYEKGLVNSVPIVSKYSHAISPNGKYVAWGRHDGSVIFDRVEFTTTTDDSAFYYSYGNKDPTPFPHTPSQHKPLFTLMSFYGWEQYGDEWIIITPDGYYNASPKGDEYLNIRYGLDVFGISQFSKAYYHPEVIDARLKGEKDSEIVKYFGDINLSVAPPAVMAEVKNKNVSSTGIAELDVRVIDAFGRYPLEDVEIIINGRLIGKKELSGAKGNNIKVDDTKISNTNLKNRVIEFSIPVELDNGNNLIEVLATNKASYGIKTINVKNNVSENSLKPDLWILSIGINDYEYLPEERDDSGLVDLSSAVGDANRIIPAFIKQEEKIFNKIYTKIIADNAEIQPTKENILEGMGFLKNAKSTDVTILFVAAHGVYDDGMFYFLPKDNYIGPNGIDPDDVDVSQGINVENILDGINVPGRKIIFIDTCQSGGINKNYMIRTLKNKSTAIFTAAKADEVSREDEEYGGYFTYSIVEALTGDEIEGEVTIEALAEYVTETVGQMSKFMGRGKVRQHPEIVIPDGFKGFVMAE